MAGFLPKTARNFHKISGARIAIIASMWHAEPVNQMVLRAKKELLLLGLEEKNISIHYLPGSAELPFAADLLYTQDKQLDAILAFGVVLRGVTTHDDIVLQSLLQGFSRVSAYFKKPIINEVIGVSCIEDAIDRAKDDDNNKGLEAVFAVSELLHWARTLNVL